MNQVIRTMQMGVESEIFVLASWNPDFLGPLRQDGANFQGNTPLMKMLG